MESALDPVLGAAFPVFALVGCGVLAGRFRLINPGSSEALTMRTLRGGDCFAGLRVVEGDSVTRVSALIASG